MGGKTVWALFGLLVAAGCGGGGGGSSAPPIPTPFDAVVADDGTFISYRLEIDYDGPAEFRSDWTLDGFDPDAVIPIRLLGTTPAGDDVVMDIDPRFAIEVVEDYSEGCFELRGGPASGYWIQGNGCDPDDPVGKKLTIQAYFYPYPETWGRELYSPGGGRTYFLFTDDPNCVTPGYMADPCL